MESGAITDDQISAPSQYSEAHGWVRARLNLGIDSKGNGGWSARKSDPNQWIQVDLGKIMTVKGVATQGRAGPYRQFVTKYNLKYSDDGQTFTDYKQEGKTSAKVITEATFELDFSVLLRQKFWFCPWQVVFMSSTIPLFHSDVNVTDFSDGPASY